MWQCYYCRTVLPPDVQAKNRMCPNCGSDIHCCKNCIHYDESSSTRCKEPNSPWVRDRGTQNSCTYFEFKAKSLNSNQSNSHDSTSEAEQAKKAFRALFREIS